MIIALCVVKVVVDSFYRVSEVKCKHSMSFSFCWLTIPYPLQYGQGSPQHTAVLYRVCETQEGILQLQEKSKGACLELKDPMSQPRDMGVQKKKKFITWTQKFVCLATTNMRRVPPTAGLREKKVASLMWIAV